MTAGELRTFLRELPEETRLDFQLGELRLELLVLGRRVGYAELHFAEGESALETRNDRPAGETPATE